LLHTLFAFQSNFAPHAGTLEAVRTQASAYQPMKFWQNSAGLAFALRGQKVLKFRAQWMAK
jgi:hypothetical protein